MVTARRYRELEIWKHSMDLCEEIYRITEQFPKHERFGLSIQMRRAAISIPSNIAEGFVRKHAKEFCQFLSMALGSLAELETQILMARRLHYLFQEQEENLLAFTETIGRMTTKFRQSLRK